MGRNNHHAGLHMIRFNRYAQYDDLEFYDKLMEKKEKEKQAIFAEKMAVIKKGKSEFAKNMVNEKAVAVKTTNNLDNKSGTEMDLIPDVYFRKCAEIYANIFLIAFEKKIDVEQLVNECEYVMANDKTLAKRSVLGFSPIELSGIFLMLLAEKMNCSVSDFYAISKELRKKKVYNILNDVLDDCMKSKYMEHIVSFGQEIGTDEYGISEFDDEYRDVLITRLDINEYYYLNINTLSMDPFPDCNMTYYIDKVEDKESKYVRYFFVVGTKPFKNKQSYQYMYGASVVHSEKTGQMKNFFESMLELYLSKGAVINNYIV